MTIASLPMYDHPEIEAFTNQWWGGLARAFRREGIADVPDALWRGDAYREPWLRPDLLLSQTCGYPLTHELRGKVSLVATPCYTAHGCEGSDYCSVIIVREESVARGIGELRGTRCAINSRGSQSGYNAFRALIARVASCNRFFSNVTVSGSHLASLKMVATGQADVAAIDCVTHALLTRYRSTALVGTRTLCLTPRAPALPYVTRADAEESGLLARLHNGLRTACEDPALSECREVLMIRAFRTHPLSVYERIVEMETEAISYGYSEVA